MLKPTATRLIPGGIGEALLGHRLWDYQSVGLTGAHPPCTRKAIVKPNRQLVLAARSSVIDAFQQRVGR
jgi:hypothetical protein